MAEGLHIMSGGADGSFKQNFDQLTQTLDNLPGRVLSELYLEFKAA
jgi:UV DNA damage repair endonuclease